MTQIINDNNNNNETPILLSARTVEWCGDMGILPNPEDNWYATATPADVADAVDVIVGHGGWYEVVHTALEESLDYNSYTGPELWDIAREMQKLCDPGVGGPMLDDSLCDRLAIECGWVH